MFTTSLAVLALATVSTLGAKSQPVWHTDYRVAIERAQELHKPLAVFIAKTPADVLQGISSDAQHRLQSGYIALMVMTNTDAGRRLADRFELSEGLVISDSSGSIQAFRSPGILSSHELAQTLERFGDPNLVVRTTESLAATQTPATSVVAPVLASTPANGSPTPLVSQPLVSPPLSSPLVSPVLLATPAPVVWQSAPSYVPTVTATTAVCRT